MTESRYHGVYWKARAKYILWSDEVDKLITRKTARENELRDLARKREIQGEAMRKSDPKIDHDFIANGLIASDTNLKELQILIDRAVALATMYGLGMLDRG